MHESEVKSVARGRDKEEGRHLISVLGGGNSGKDSRAFTGIRYVHYAIHFQSSGRAVIMDSLDLCK